MPRPKQPIKDPLLAKWLSEFKAATTQSTYLGALRRFKKALGIEDLGEYINNSPNVAADIRKFLATLDGKPSKSVSTYTAAVKMFLQDHGVKIEDDDWRKIKRRGFMPKRVKAETRDKKPNKTRLKQVLNYADIKCRSMVLFLVSSGARIGETLQLKMEDFNLDADPPSAHIRSEYTKGGVGARTVYFSYEARDAIRDWLQVKDTTTKRDGSGTFESERMFPWTPANARYMWNMACDKARIGDKDNNTNRRIYHLHSLRKFFRTKIGLDLDVTHGLMGHTEYLDEAYLRLEETGEIAKVYLEAMSNVSIYEVEDQQLRKQTSALEEENVDLKTRLNRVELELTDLRKMLQKLISE